MPSVDAQSSLMSKQSPMSKLPPNHTNSNPASYNASPSLRTHVTKAPLPNSDFRQPPKRTASLSRQKSLTEIAAETAATVIGSDQAAALNNSGSQAVEFLSGKLSTALSFLTSNVSYPPSQSPLVLDNESRGTNKGGKNGHFSCSNPNLATTELSTPIREHRTLTKMSSNTNGISTSSNDTGSQLLSRSPKETDAEGDANSEQLQIIRDLNGFCFSLNQGTESKSYSYMSATSDELPLSGKLPEAMVATNPLVSSALKDENESLRREVERQREQIRSLELTLDELQKKNVKLEEMILALQRSSANNVDTNSERSLPVSTPSIEAGEDAANTSLEYPSKSMSPSSRNPSSNVSSPSQHKLSPGSFKPSHVYHHQKSASDAQFFSNSSSSNTPPSRQPPVKADSEENYEAISHEYSSIAHFVTPDSTSRTTIAASMPRTPEPNSKASLRFGGSTITRTGSYSEKRHFAVTSTGSPMGTSLDREENQYNSVPDLLDKNFQDSVSDVLHTSASSGHRAHPKKTAKNMMRMMSPRHNGEHLGAPSDLNSNLSDNSPVEFSDSPRMSQFSRGSTARNTAGPRMLINRGVNQQKGMEARLVANADTPFKSWDVEQIAYWLTTIGLNRYVSYISSQRINGAKMAAMTPLDIEKSMRMKNSLHRKKLLLAIRAQLVGNSGDFVEMDSIWVARWLDDIGLPQHKDTFLESCVDGRVLHYLTFDDFALLKVYSAVHQISIGRAIQYLRIQGWKVDSFIRRSNNLTDESCLLHWSNHRVMEWLRSIDLSEYAPNLRGSGVHGALMCLEPRFTADTLADLLHIPVSKTLLRRHLVHHFDTLIGPMCKEHKRLIESSPYYQPLNIHYKVKPNKSRFIKKPKSQNRGVTVGSVDDLVCPLEFEVPSHVPREALPQGYVITSKDFSRSDPPMVDTSQTVESPKMQPTIARSGFV